VHERVMLVRLIYDRLVVVVVVVGPSLLFHTNGNEHTGSKEREILRDLLTKRRNLKRRT
jgi:hypothetical protein